MPEGDSGEVSMSSFEESKYIFESEFDQGEIVVRGESELCESGMVRLHSESELFNPSNFEEEEFRE
jgi:hypothetical protein